MPGEDPLEVLRAEFRAEIDALRRENRELRDALGEIEKRAVAAGAAAAAIQLLGAERAKELQHQRDGDGGTDGGGTGVPEGARRVGRWGYVVPPLAALTGAVTTGAKKAVEHPMVLVGGIVFAAGLFVAGLLWPEPGGPPQVIAGPTMTVTSPTATPTATSTATPTATPVRSPSIATSTDDATGPGRPVDGDSATEPDAVTDSRPTVTRTRTRRPDQTRPPEPPTPTETETVTEPPATPGRCLIAADVDELLRVRLNCG